VYLFILPQLGTSRRGCATILDVWRVYRSIILIQVNGTKARIVRPTCQVMLKVMRSVGCWGRRSTPDSSLRLARRRPQDETTSSRGMIFITRPNHTDRQSLLLYTCLPTVWLI